MSLGECFDTAWLCRGRELSTAAINSAAIVAGDFNGDGNPDLATLSHCADGQCHNGSLSVLLGNGDGSFNSRSLTPIGHRRNDCSR